MKQFLPLLLSLMALSHVAQAVARMSFAEEVKSGKHIHVQHAVPGPLLHKCLDCKAWVSKVAGDTREQHFRHEAEKGCRGVRGSESPEHRMAKRKIEAILRTGGVLKIQNCNDLCRRDCRSVVRLLDDEEVKVEYPLPNGEGIADVAIIDKLSVGRRPRVILEIFHTHKTESRRGVWHELDATEVNNARYRDGVLTLHEVRDEIPKDRGCRAYAFKDLVHLAGYHTSTLREADTFEHELFDHCDNAAMNDDPRAAAVVNGPLREKAKWFIESDLSAPMHRIFRHLNEGVEVWADALVNYPTAKQRAHQAIIASKRCIACERRFENKNFKLLCPKCFAERSKQRRADEEDMMEE